ncbi:MAG: RNA-binding protein [Pseudomonadales bacterium]|jgi:RNA recognition motif-containing protein|nr:RNA-binding protein [Pseudomonadales bacterium]
MSDDNLANAKKIFVGNLAFKAMEQDLADFFGQYGEVAEVILLSDRRTGRSRGMAFVEFVTEDAAKEALEKANGATLLDREIRVDLSKPRTERPRDGGGYGGNRGGYGGGRGGDRGGYGGQRRSY